MCKECCKNDDMCSVLAGICLLSSLALLESRPTMRAVLAVFAYSFFLSETNNVVDSIINYARKKKKKMESNRIETND